MARVLDPRKSAEKFKRNAQAAQGDFVEGAKNPRRDQKEASLAAEPAWKAGMQLAIAEDRRYKAVQRQDPQKWLRGIVEKGATRYGQGIALAEDDYAKGVAPYFDILNQIDDVLPPRGPKGDPQNYERSKVVGQLLHEAKLKLCG